MRRAWINRTQLFVVQFQRFVFTTLVSSKEKLVKYKSICLIPLDSVMCRSGLHQKNRSIRFE